MNYKRMIRFGVILGFAWFILNGISATLYAQDSVTEPIPADVNSGIYGACIIYDTPTSSPGTIVAATEKGFYPCDPSIYEGEVRVHDAPVPQEPSGASNISADRSGNFIPVEPNDGDCIITDPVNITGNTEFGFLPCDENYDGLVRYLAPMHTDPPRTTVPAVSVAPPPVPLTPTTDVPIPESFSYVTVEYSGILFSLAL
jgi:hypothetical protein